uniref:hypothetical chloroplast RF19 n=1 Tax=Yoania amagiensis TaxID=1891309 RepID=UPI0021CCCFC2|nr:hypothetical chloroplast RF19 [Yoania amagiensis]UWT59968.1 hypothetical chloroplast RF19 [Yoania amagiensis]
MIFKSFILVNPLFLCMKIINSAIFVSLYYGFMTTFSIGPSYIFLIRDRVIMEEVTEKEASATTGFIAGQLMMFISIYYAPLHLALDRPHTITVLVLPYLLLHLFCNTNTNKKLFYYRYNTNRNSMRDLSIQCVFLNNLIFQLFNHFILPSSTLARLVNIYMFRCNNNILFLLNSFIGWLIGYILFIKLVELILFWIRQNNYIRSNKYLVSKFQNFMVRIFSILLFIICIYYLGRMPSPIVTKKMKYKEIPEMEEIQMNGKEKTKYEFNLKMMCYKDRPVPFYEDSNLEIHQYNLELERLKEYKNKRMKKKKIEKTFVSFLFDYKRWNRPLRYIKNDKLENALRNEMSQFFFFTCTSYGKQIISFTYPPSLSIFLEMLEQKISLYIIENLYDEYIYNSWIYTNEKKKFNLSNELKSRIKNIEKNEESTSLNMLEKRILLCYNEKKKCLPKAYDPLLNGPYRLMRKKFYSRAIMNTYKDTENLLEFFFINKIHDLLINDFVKIKHKSFFNCTEEKGIYSENKAKYLQLLFDVITTHKKDKKKITKKYIELRIKEIIKKVSRWSYKLTENLEEEEEENEEEELEEEYYDIHSRRAKRVIIYNENDQDTNYINNTSKNDRIEDGKITLIRYSQQSDFRRNIIKGSMRAQRRKTFILDLFQVNVHSPLFSGRLDKTFFFFSFYINYIKKIKNWMDREQKSEFKISYFENKYTKEEKDKEEQTKISEAWDTFIFTQVIRSLMLVTQSFIRKYIRLPSLIIAKNIFRMLLFQISEWGEDLKEWDKEIHIKCTYNSVQLSEKEFPQDWLINGIQIKILYPFCLKPWRNYKVRSNHSHHIDIKKKQYKKPNYCFLTIWGMEAEVPFGSPQKRPFFFEPIYKELKKRKKKVKNKFLKVIKFLNKKIKKYFFKNTNGKKINNTNDNFELSKEKVYERNDNLIFERTTKEKKKIELGIIYDKKLLESHKYILKILKSKNIRLMCKLYYFIKIKLFIEKIYINILIYIIKIYKINAQILSKSTKNIFNKLIYKNEINKEQDKIYEINKNTMKFIFTIKKLVYNINNINLSYNTYWNLYSLSQSYVFYKILQNKLFNKYQFKPVLKYKSSHHFFKDILKDYCMIHGIFNYKSIHKHNKIHTYVINECKNWLKGNYQNESKQLYFYKKYKWKKNYRYDILSYKYISLNKDKKINIDQEIPYHLNYLNTLKLESFYLCISIFRNNYRIDRKYFYYMGMNKKIEMNKEKLYDTVSNNNTITNIKTWFFPEFLLFFDFYKKKPWTISIRSLFFHLYINEKSKNINVNTKKYKKVVEEDCAILKIKKSIKKKQYKKNNEMELVDLDLFLKKYLLFQLRWANTFNNKIMKNIRVYCFLLRLINPKEITISLIQRDEIYIDEILIQKDLVIEEFIRKGIFIIEPICLSIQMDGKYIIYQIIDISLVYNNKHQTNKKYTKKRDIYKGFLKKFIAWYSNKILIRNKHNYGLLIPENIISPRHRREFRIRICFNYRNFNVVGNNTIFLNENKIIKCGQFFNFFNGDKHINKYIKNSIKFKLFLWPNYRLEDIICMNRYWFNTNNSSHFSMSRIHMYSQFRIN